MADSSKTEELLDSILAAHGGLERWHQVDRINLRWLFHGAVAELKGYPGHWDLSMVLNVDGPPATIMTGLGYGQPGERWAFTTDRVWIEDSTGNLLQERHHPRASFEGHTRATPWDALHLNYFLSYAMYNYLTVPFIFTRPGFALRELPAHREPGSQEGDWRVLEVTHPDGFPTHTKVQRFYFGSQDFLLRRLDYEVDVFGGVAAHYVFDYKEIAGLKFPTARRVTRRLPDVDGGKATLQQAQTPFWLQYFEVEVVDKDGKAEHKGRRVFSL